MVPQRNCTFLWLFLLILTTKGLNIQDVMDREECLGRQVGIYTDGSPDCTGYVYCNGKGRSGLRFPCPPGTSFRQDTLVCDHSHKVKCSKSLLSDIQDKLEGFADRISVDSLDDAQDRNNNAQASFITRHPSPAEASHGSPSSFLRYTNPQSSSLRSLSSRLLAPFSFRPSQRVSVQGGSVTKSEAKSGGGSSAFSSHNGQSSQDRAFSTVLKDVEKSSSLLQSTTSSVNTTDTYFPIGGYSQHADVSLSETKLKGSALTVSRNVVSVRVPPTKLMPPGELSEAAPTTSWSQAAESKPPRPSTANKVGGSEAKSENPRSIRQDVVLASKRPKPELRQPVKPISVVSRPEVRLKPPAVHAKVSLWPQVGYEEPITLKVIKPVNDASDKKHQRESGFGGQINEVDANEILVKPRGPVKGFFNRDKLEKFQFFSRTSTERSVSHTPKIIYGFKPIDSEKKLSEPSNSINPQSSESSSYRKAKELPPLDQLVPPDSPKRSFKRNNNRLPTGGGGDAIGGGSGSGYYASKSIFDFLGIFDTRKFFYIPPNRRSLDTDDNSWDSMFSRLFPG